jgi:hypothetical protein
MGLPKTRRSPPNNPTWEGAIINEFIVTKYVIPRVLFTNADFRDLAIRAFLEKHSDIDPSMSLFNVSAGFELQNGFSIRWCHFQRHPPPVSVEIKRLWRSRLESLLRGQPRDRILNCDENYRQACPNRLKTWAVKGSSKVALKTKGPGKDHFTVMTMVTPTRPKLPLTLLASGRGELCEFSQLENVEIHRPDRTQSCWTTEGIFF